MRKTGLLLSFAAGFGLLSACGTSSKSEGTETTDTTKMEAHAPETQKRASPLMKITGTAGTATINVQYGAPSVKGRVIWGGLESYDKVWRTGANEATVFAIDKDVTIQGQKLAAGRYGLFTIPTKGEWTVIFNKNADQWGAYDYKETEDVLRVKATPLLDQELVEVLKFEILAKEEGKADVVLSWEKLKLTFEVAEVK